MVRLLSLTRFLTFEVNSYLERHFLSVNSNAIYTVKTKLHVNNDVSKKIRLCIAGTWRKLGDKVP